MINKIFKKLGSALVLLWTLSGVATSAWAQLTFPLTITASKTTPCTNEVVTYTVSWNAATHPIQGNPTGFTWTILSGNGQFVGGSTGHSVQIKWTASGPTNFQVKYQGFLTDPSGNLPANPSTVTYTGPYFTEVHPAPSALGITPSTTVAGFNQLVTASAPNITGRTYTWSYSKASNPSQRISIAVNTHQTPAIAASESLTFYLKTTSNGCTSAETSAVVNVVQPPTVYNNQTDLGVAHIAFDGTTQVSTSAGTHGNACRWYDAASGGNLLGQGTANVSVALSNPLGVKTLYVSSYHAATGVESQRVAYKVLRLNVVPIRIQAQPSFYCGSGDVTAQITIDGWPGGFPYTVSGLPNGQLSYGWYNQAGGTLGTDRSQNFIAVNAPTTYYAEVTFHGVTSTRIGFPLFPGSTPNTPQVVSVQDCGGTVQLTGASAGEQYQLKIQRAGLLPGEWSEVMVPGFTATSTTGVFQVPAAYNLQPTIRYEARVVRVVDPTISCESSPIVINYIEPNIAGHRLSVNNSSPVCGETVRINLSLGNGTQASLYRWRIERTSGDNTTPIVEVHDTPGNQPYLDWASKEGVSKVSVQFKTAEQGCWSLRMHLPQDITSQPPVNPLLITDVVLTECHTLKVLNPQPGVIYHLAQRMQVTTQNANNESSTEWVDAVPPMTSSNGIFTGLTSRAINYQLRIEQANTCISVPLNIYPLVQHPITYLGSTCVGTQATVTLNNTIPQAHYVWKRKRLTDQTVVTEAMVAGQNTWTFTLDTGYEVWVEDENGCKLWNSTKVLNTFDQATAPRVVAEQTSFCAPNGRTILRVKDIPGGVPGDELRFFDPNLEQMVTVQGFHTAPIVLPYNNNGVKFRWYKDDPNVLYKETREPFLVTEALTTNTTYYVRIKAPYNTCESAPAQIDLTVHPVLPRPVMLQFSRTHFQVERCYVSASK